MLERFLGSSHQRRISTLAADQRRWPARSVKGQRDGDEKGEHP